MIDISIYLPCPELGGDSVASVLFLGEVIKQNQAKGWLSVLGVVVRCEATNTLNGWLCETKRWRKMRESN